MMVMKTAFEIKDVDILLYFPLYLQCGQCLTPLKVVNKAIIAMEMSNNDRNGKSERA